MISDQRHQPVNTDVGRDRLSRPSMPIADVGLAIIGDPDLASDYVSLLGDLVSDEISIFAEVRCFYSANVQAGVGPEISEIEPNVDRLLLSWPGVFARCPCRIWSVSFSSPERIRSSDIKLER